MKKLICLVIVLAISSIVSAGAPEPGMVEREDFEDCIPGVDIMSDGWEPQWSPGSGSPIGMIGSNVENIGGETGIRAIHGSGSGFATGKPAELPNTLTTADTKVYFKAQHRPYAANGFAGMAVYQAPPQPASTNAGYYNTVGVGTADVFTLKLTTLLNDVVGTPGLLGSDYDWEFGVNMTIDYVDPSLSVGTVLYRPWGSSGSWSVDPLLVDVPLDMHYGWWGDQPENVPTAWNAFYMREEYSGQHDNLEYGRGHIPEPCTMALLGLGGLLLRRRRR